MQSHEFTRQISSKISLGERRLFILLIEVSSINANKNHNFRVLSMKTGYVFIFLNQQPRNNNNEPHRTHIYKLFLVLIFFYFKSVFCFGIEYHKRTIVHENNMFEVCRFLEATLSTKMNQSMSNFLKFPSMPNKSPAFFGLPGRNFSLTRRDSSSSL